jgi:hypothetical protein
MGNWTIIVPEAGTNLVRNPSAEADGNWGPLLASPSTSASPSGSASPSSSASISPSGSSSPSASQSRSPSASASRSPSASASPSGSASPSASVSPSPSASAGLQLATRVTTYARAGDYCYFVPTSNAYDGAAFALQSALSNAIHYVSAYLRGSATGTFQFSLNGNSYYTASAIGGATGGWVRYGVQIPAIHASGGTNLYIRNTVDEDFYADCLQVEQAEYPTTYIDGDQGPLYRWTGLRHGSSSTRDAQERSGGRERDFDTDYDIQVVEGTKRLGMPPLRHNLMAQALQPGAVHQGYKVLPREIELKFMFEADDWADFHSRRKTLIDLLKPDAVRGAQPVVIGYAGADSGTKVYASFHYAGGLEFGDFLGLGETPTVRLLAPDPFWYEDNRETAALDFTDSLTAAYGLRRKDGQWQALGTGFNGPVLGIASDPARGRVYFIGNFTTANGVTVNGICYWNGTTFVAMGAGLTGGTVYSGLALAPSGDVWVGGNFTSAGGVTADGLARYNVATDSWTQFTNGTPGNTIYSLVIDASGNVYGAGNFTNWDGIAAADYIWKYDGSSFSAVGTSPFSADAYPASSRSLAIDASGNLWTGEFFHTGSGTVSVRKWDGSAWTTVLTTDSRAAAAVHALYFDNDGTLYVGGTFGTIGGVTAAHIATYNGTAARPLGSGLTGGKVRNIRRWNEQIIVGGGFTAAGGLSLADGVAAWNGTTWVHLDVDFPASSTIYGVEADGDDLYLGFDQTGTATVAGIATLTNSGSTTAFPDITIIGPASSTSTLQLVENQTTEENLYFNLTVNTLEYIGISFQPGAKRVVSLWSQRPGKTPLSRIGTPTRATFPQRAAGVILGQPLPSSDFANFHLQAGANTLAAFMTGATTATMLMHWTPRYWSVDGAA